MTVRDLIHTFVNWTNETTVAISYNSKLLTCGYRYIDKEWGDFYVYSMIYDSNKDIIFIVVGKEKPKYE